MATPTEIVNRMASQKGVILAPRPEVLDQVKIIEAEVTEMDTPRTQSLTNKSHIVTQQVSLADLNIAFSAATIFKTILDNPDSDPAWMEMSPFERIQEKLREVHGTATTDVEALEPATLNILNLQDVLIKAKNNQGRPEFGEIVDKEHGIRGFVQVTALNEIDGQIPVEMDVIGGNGIILTGNSLATQLRGVSEIKILWTRDPMLLPKVEEKEEVKDHQNEDPAKAAVAEGITKPLNPFLGAARPEDIKF